MIEKIRVKGVDYDLGGSGGNGVKVANLTVDINYEANALTLYFNDSMPRIDIQKGIKIEFYNNDNFIIDLVFKLMLEYELPSYQMLMGYKGSVYHIDTTEIDGLLLHTMGLYNIESLEDFYVQFEAQLFEQHFRVDANQLKAKIYYHEVDKTSLDVGFEY